MGFVLMCLRGLLAALVGLVVLGVAPGGAFAAGACPNEALREAQGSTFLGECRAWEMVSPPDKNGGDVMSSPMRTRSSVSGDAVTFASLSAFGDVQGTNIASEYVGQRDATGWGVHGITPPQDPTAFVPTVGNETQLVGEASGDLSTAVVYALKPLTEGAPNVAKVPNLYLRRDLLSDPPGNYELLTDSVNALPIYLKNHPNVYFDGASEDFRHLIFETTNNLTVDATGSEYKLYEWEEGTLRLAGILPGGEPAQGSVAGLGQEREVPGTGGVIDNYVLNTISRDGSRVFFTDTSTGMIYVRENHSTSVQLNVSEKTNGAGAGGTDPAGPKVAFLTHVTPNGTQVLFRTTEQMVNEDNNDGMDLYRYDSSAAVGHRLTLLSRNQETGEAGGGVTNIIGLSDDGNTVYFHGDKSSPLVTGLPLVNPNSMPIYVWRNGSLKYIGADEGGDLVEVGERIAEGSGTPQSDFRVAPDGTLLYATPWPQTSYDTTSNNCFLGVAQLHLCDEVYVYTPSTDQLVCASCDPSGAPPTGRSLFTLEADHGVGLGGNQHLSHAVSADGSRVFFDSPNALVARDTNSKYDVYEYDVLSGEVHLISTGQSNRDSLFVEASPDGHNVFFTTRQRLLSRDIDNNSDFYDARVDGGIAAQNASPVDECGGDACQGDMPDATGLPFAGSAVVSGAGNLPSVVSAPAVKAKAKAKAKRRHKAKHRTKRRRAKKAGRPGKSASHRAGR